MNNTFLFSTNIMFAFFMKIFLLLLCVLIIIFLFIIIKQINTMNKQKDFCLRDPLVSVVKVFIYLTIILALFVFLLI